MQITNPNEFQYLNLLRQVLTFGDVRENRTETPARSMFGLVMKFDLTDSAIPLLTTKRLHFKSILRELLWFIRGDTNIGYLNEHGVSIWNEWANKRGELGPIYGKQWRDWSGVDQLATVIDNIRLFPYSRRHIVSAWNVSELDKMALPPCHILYQFYVSEGTLSCQMYQRSADVFLGLPYNIASYALLTNIVAHLTGLIPKCLSICIGDAHIYENHVEQVRVQLMRTVPEKIPKISIDKSFTCIEELTAQHIVLHDYFPLPALPGKVAI